MGIGVGGAVVGVLLDMTIKDVKFVLALGGLLILTMAAFVLFRAMLSAAERNEEPAKTALTHPLFMLLFVVLATATALFIGLLRRAY
jgi:predicted lipid-binding transport protein (Tim44 family)